MKNTNCKILFGCVSVLTMLALSACKGKDAGEQVTYVKTEVVAETSGSGQVSYPARTKASDEVNASFRVSGQIARMCVSEGDHVSRGQLLAVMDSRDYQVQLNATQAEYQQVKADAERIIAMYDEGNTTASNYDKARFGLQQIEQKLANHRNQLADTKLYSPIDGYVQSVLHEGGETVSAGMPVVALFSSQNVEVELNISAFDYANRDRMTSVTCKFDLIDEEFPMKIESISAEANASRLYTVRLRFMGDYDHSRITPGMTAMVYVNIDGGDDTPSDLSIPSTALLEKGGKTYVMVYDAKSGKVSQRGVEVESLDSKGRAKIRSGVKAGDEIVIAGVHHISDGQSVRPVAKTSESNVGGLL